MLEREEKHEVKTNAPEDVCHVQGRTTELTDSLHLGLADGNDKVFGLRLVGHLKGNAVHELVLQENH